MYRKTEMKDSVREIYVYVHTVSVLEQANLELTM